MTICTTRNPISRTISVALLAALPLTACVDPGDPAGAIRAADHLRLEPAAAPVALAVPTPQHDVTIRPHISGIGLTVLFGGTGTDLGSKVSGDSSGNAYLLGTTALCTGSSAFVAKFTAAGSTVYAFCLPGTTTGGVVADGGGNAYVAAGSSLFKFGPTGTTIYGVGLGLTLSGLAVDGGGNAYVISRAVGAGFDVAVAKLNAAGTALVYNAVFGGSSDDTANGIAVDGNGDAYVVGTTTSTNFPLSNAIQVSLQGGQDAFVSKLDPTGSVLLFSTYLGGPSLDYGNAIAVDNAGSAYIGGNVASIQGVEGFPVTSGAAQFSPPGGGDAYVTKLNASGGKVYATYVGGSGADTADGIAVDRVTGAAVLTGTTQSTNFPTTVLTSLISPPDAYIAQLNPAGSAYSFARYLGGTSTDVGSGAAVDSGGRVYIGGSTFSPVFPSSGGVANHGDNDAYVIRFNP
jgi:hypothetical protein